MGWLGCSAPRKAATSASTAASVGLGWAWTEIISFLENIRTLVIVILSRTSNFQRASPHQVVPDDRQRCRWQSRLLIEYRPSVTSRIQIPSALQTSAFCLASELVPNFPCNGKFVS